MRRSSTRPPERGASAVEFALVAPLLFGLLFGIVDYGLYFADVMSAEQGVGNAARAATLAPQDPSGTLQWAATPCPSDRPVIGIGPLVPLACSAMTATKPLVGTLYAKVLVVDSSGTVTSTWAPGSRLRVCTLTRHAPILPMVPLPQGGLIRARVDMPVQTAAPAPMTAVAADLSTVDPVVGADWSWC